VFVVLGACCRVSFLVLFNYFILQEVLGLLLLLGLSGVGSCFLLAKLGVAPFHFWGFYLLEHLRGQLLL